MESNKTLEGILDLAKAANELKNAQANLDISKTAKAQLDRDIALLKKQKEELIKKFEADKVECNKVLSELNDKIAKATAKLNDLRNSLAPEKTRLQNLHDEAKSLSVNAIKEQLKAEQLLGIHSKAQAELEAKKAVIGQIVELSKQL